MKYRYLVKRAGSYWVVYDRQRKEEVNCFTSRSEAREHARRIRAMERDMEPTKEMPR